MMILTDRPKLFLQAWTYGLDGQLLKATRITGIQNFNVKVCCENSYIINHIRILVQYPLNSRIIWILSLVIEGRTLDLYQ